MKKILALLMAVLMVVSLAACGKPAAPKNESKIIFMVISNASSI